MNSVVKLEHKDVNAIPFQEASLDIWDKKYRLTAKDGTPIDASMDDTFKRVARALADVELPAQREIWQSVVALPKFEGDKVVELKLIPITLGFGRPAGVRGRPVLAAPDEALKILADLVRMSEPLGTKIENRNGVGYVVLPP